MRFFHPKFKKWWCLWGGCPHKHHHIIIFEEMCWQKLQHAIAKFVYLDFQDLTQNHPRMLFHVSGFLVDILVVTTHHPA
jgi:hypothetical protein